MDITIEHVNRLYALALDYHSKGNFKAAADAFKELSDKNIIGASLNLGLLYLNGEGVEKNVNKAIQLLLKDADLGQVDAQRMLGYMYSMGENVEQDLFKAMELFKKAAAKGDTESQAALDNINKAFKVTGGLK